jgi:DNA modification methylase
MSKEQQELKIQKIKVSELVASTYNPRKWSDEAITGLTESVQRFGLVDPILANSAENRKNIVIGGHFRLKVAKDLGVKEVPVVYVNIPDEAKEKELNLRLNKNVGEFDYELLAEFDEALLADIGFNSEELDGIFNEVTDEPDDFDLQKELEKLDIKEITAKEGDVYQLGDSRLMCGDSTNAEHFEKLMGDEKADMCMTDPPYILDYLHGKRKGGAEKGFGAKQNRVYLGTESLPDNFTELWMANLAKHSNDNFSIIVYENWKNLRVIWAEMEKYWKVKNMIVWHLPNRHQGFAAKYKFFSKHDIAMVGGKGNVEYNHDEEEAPLQEMYQTALYAIQGKPQWEGYEHGKQALLQPTDFIDYNADDEKHSGQNVVFGTKPLNILIPYIKFLTKRGDLVVEPFCGSGSTLIASTKLGRRCFIMEKQPIYAEVALARWEKETGLKRQLISGASQDAQDSKTR